MEFLSVMRTIFLTPIRFGQVSFPFTLSGFLLEFVLPVLIFFVAFRLFMLFMRRILEKTKLREDVRTKIFRWTRLVIRVIFLVFIIVFIGRIFGAELFRYISMFYNLLSTPFFESDQTKISLITILLLIPIFYIASWIARTTLSFVNRSILSNISIDEAQRFTITSIIRYGVMILVVLIGLSIVGINLSSLTVIFGVLGIGLGFGLQHVVANFFAGIIIIFTRPVKEGDRVIIQTSEGTVTKIRLLSSVVNTLFNESIIVPNSQLINDKIYNYSYEDRHLITINEVQVAYSSDLDLVLKVLEEVAAKNPYLVQGREITTRVTAFQDSGIQVKLLTWIRDVANKYDSLSWTNLEIWRAFRENRITIPFPQRDVHMIGKTSISG